MSSVNFDVTPEELEALANKIADFVDKFDKEGKSASRLKESLELTSSRLAEKAEKDVETDAEKVKRDAEIRARVSKDSKPSRRERLKEVRDEAYYRQAAIDAYNSTHPKSKK